MSRPEQVRELLSRKPGLKAQQIADELGLARGEALTLLHGMSGGEVVQDKGYRWWVRAGIAAERPDSASSETLLARLCRYYLACLSFESGVGISLPADETSGYVELEALPFAVADELRGDRRAVSRLAQRVRTERGQLALYVGYAVRLRRLDGRDTEGTRLEPILLYPITEEAGTAAMRPASGVPLFNLDALKSLSAAETGNALDEALQLADDLGLSNTAEELPPWDEIILRLQRCRPDWDWREPLDPYGASRGAAVGKLPEPGIYNRAVLFAATRSPFTYGLEIELRKLAQSTDDDLRETALGAWLRTETAASGAPQDRPILEPLPLNAEQREAVVRGLVAPLTVVTGPPGTGKSQVVTSLLANVAWQGGSALFSSKNNHAVDVVEMRVNALAPHPLLLRLGKEEHAGRIAGYLGAELAGTATAEDEARYRSLVEAHVSDCARFDAVQREIATVIALRNEVDDLERAAEGARSLFGEDRFVSVGALDVAGARERLDALRSAIDAASGAAHSPVARILGDRADARRLRRIAADAADLRESAELLGMAPAGLDARERTLDGWRAFHAALAERLGWAERIAAYRAALDRLRAAPPIERLAGELMRIGGEAARSSLELWQVWLKLRPRRWNPAQRRLLSEYVSLLQIIANGDRQDDGPGRVVLRRYYSLFPEIVKHLPCWAVTSLSARGRLPFSPAIFDTVVIDEASQCDIASALPLLYRARRAVIIGDPLQLKHVSTVAPQQDRLLLAAHGLAEGQAAWAYSVNSLFDLARSVCSHDDIVNLRDHHRSHRDIIGFSNRHFYRGNLRIATNHDLLKTPGRGGPAVQWIDVKGRVTLPSGGGAVNAPEAEAVVAEVRKLVAAGYSGAIGVVTPFRGQANRIRALVHRDAELVQLLAPLDFIVDTVHGFQGDERDVMFFSPVVSAGIGESTLRFLKNHGNLFNVAITRARSALIVVGDGRAALNCGVAYLAGFAEYARDLDGPGRASQTSGAAGPEYPPVAHPERVSEWERVFYRALYCAGLRPIPQYDEAPHTLDFALFDGERKLDIEVDGENYHRQWDGELCRRDQIRSRRLRDLGWDVMRFWVYEIRDDLSSAVRRVQGWVDAGRPS